MIFKIGMPYNEGAEKYTASIQTTLIALGMDCLWIPVGKPEEHITDKLMLLESALQSGEIDAFIFPHKFLPTTQKEGIVITASGPRENAADVLLIHPKGFDAKAVFRLQSQAIVKATTAIQQVQLADYRQDVLIDMVSNNITEVYELLLQGQIDALLISGDDWHTMALDSADLHTIQLNPMEFVPAPAQGVWVWLCNRDDNQTRRALRPLHHTETSSMTNVERSILRQYNDEHLLAVHCERDARGFVHAFAARYAQGALKRARISSSTTFGLGDALKKQLD